MSTRHFRARALASVPLHVAALLGAGALGTVAVFAPVATATAFAAPSWAHQKLAAQGNATVWVEDVISTGNQSTMRIEGTGWLTSEGQPSTVAVKLNKSSSDQFVRPNGALSHASAKGDATIWALLVPGGSQENQVFEVAPDGSFAATVALPAGLTDGQYLTATISSGLIAGDTKRGETTKPLQVGTTRGTEESLGEDTCTTDVPTASVKIETPKVEPGGVLRISGEGWCHPEAGGSTIGVKIDEGNYRHLNTAVHSNTSIWAIVEADKYTGRFTADITMPDGTTATSNPALTDGSHTLRVLSGTLKPKDENRTLLTDSFTVGTYRPNGAPDPIDAATLVDATRGGVAVTQSGNSVTAFVPQRRAGDWVHLSAYLPNSSPSYPWGAAWHRLDAQGRVTLNLPANAPAGPVKIVVTNGNEGATGEVLGWDDATFPAKAPAPSAAPPAQSEPKAKTKKPGKAKAKKAPTATPIAAPGAVAASTVAGLVATPVAAPLSEPSAPAKNYVGVGLLEDGGLEADQNKARLQVRFPQGTEGDLVHTRVYGADDVAAGWGTLDGKKSLLLDLSALPAGSYRLVFQAADGSLLGWVEVNWEPVAKTAAAQPASESNEVAPLAEAPIRAAGASWQPGATDGILLGLGAAAAGISMLVRRRQGGAA